MCNPGLDETVLTKTFRRAMSSSVWPNWWWCASKRFRQDCLSRLYNQSSVPDCNLSAGGWGWFEKKDVQLSHQCEQCVDAVRCSRCKHGDPAADQIVRGPSGGCRGDLISMPDSGYYRVFYKSFLSGKLTFWRVFWKAKSSSFVLMQKASF